MAKKSKFILVVLQSLVSGHRHVAVRPRTNEKLEMLRWDPTIGQHSVYVELKKIKSCKY